MRYSDADQVLARQRLKARWVVYILTLTFGVGFLPLYWSGQYSLYQIESESLGITVDASGEISVFRDGVHLVPETDQVAVLKDGIAEIVFRFDLDRLAIEEGLRPRGIKTLFTRSIPEDAPKGMKLDGALKVKFDRGSLDRLITKNRGVDFEKSLILPFEVAVLRSLPHWKNRNAFLASIQMQLEKELHRLTRGGISCEVVMTTMKAIDSSPARKLTLSVGNKSVVSSVNFLPYPTSLVWRGVRWGLGLVCLEWFIFSLYPSFLWPFIKVFKLR